MIRGSQRTSESGPIYSPCKADSPTDAPSANCRCLTNTTEVTGFTRLLEPFDLAGVVVTADVLHTHRGHAKWLV